MQLLEQVIAAIAPHNCLSCGAEGNVLCSVCALALPHAPPCCYRCGKLSEAGQTCRSCRRSSALKSVEVVTLYDGLAKEVVAKLKFGRAQAAAKGIAWAIAGRLGHNVERLVVTHVPTANTRVRERGYDQAQLIARELAKELGVPHVALLARVGSVRQLGASGELRRMQLRSALRPLKPYLLQGANVLLVDDVITTGSTLEAAAQTLKTAGARSIRAVVFARA